MKKFFIAILCFAGLAFGSSPLEASTVSSFVTNGSASGYVYNLSGLTVSCTGTTECSSGHVSIG